MQHILNQQGSQVIVYQEAYQSHYDTKGIIYMRGLPEGSVGGIFANVAIVHEGHEDIRILGGGSHGGV